VFGGGFDRTVGLELEWLCRTADGGRPSLATLEALVQKTGPRLTHGGRLTIEPGGQLEISTAPLATFRAACEAAANDLLTLEQACTRYGIDLIALGHDPDRSPDCLRTDTPRYAAMLRYFETRWPEASEMMTNTASIQVNVGLGLDHADAERRWRLAHDLGPTMIAAFANSPFANGRPTGWKSTRWGRWRHIDPARTGSPKVRSTPADEFVDYALRAPVMLIVDGDDCTALTDPFPFARWMDEGHELGWPTQEDLEYHLTTLFPPIRPRGWYEVRYLDALPTPFWQVAASVIGLLLDEAALADEATDALAGTTALWEEAARDGLDHPQLGTAARRLFSSVLDELASTGHDGTTEAVVATYFEHWIARNRCPADDRLDHWRRTGELVPRAESPIPYAAFEAVEP
jgi:glutamate--cysteine ligase